MITFCIGSPHKNTNWYDYRIYINLIESLEILGYKYEKNSKNRIYFLGGSLKNSYPDISSFDKNANNIALVYCHSGSIKTFVDFDHIFVSSTGMKKMIILRALKRALFMRPKYIELSKKIEIIPPFSSLCPTNKKDPTYECDISFVGNIRIRPIVEDVIKIVKKHNLDLKIYGDNWNDYQGNQEVIKYWQGSIIPYENIPLLAHNSKICLVDHHEEMNKEGTLSHKYVDLIMSRACLISDKNKGIKKYSGKSYATLEQLEALILKMLGNHDYRELCAKEQYEKVKNNTTLNSAKAIASYFVGTTVS